MNLLSDKIEHIDIFLASKSPRRQDLLKNIIPKFDIISKEIDEIYPEDLNSLKIAEYLAKLKATAYLSNSSQKNLFITADTIVVLNNKVLGKPKDYNDAFNMIKSLSGNTHTVHTGVAILHNGNIDSFQDNTHVTFYELNDQEIDFYIQNHQPFDKAGAYGIQEWMGYVGIKKIEGDFFSYGTTSTPTLQKN